MPQGFLLLLVAVVAVVAGVAVVAIVAVVDDEGDARRAPKTVILAVVRYCLNAFGTKITVNIAAPRTVFSICFAPRNTNHRIYMYL